MQMIIRIKVILTDLILADEHEGSFVSRYKNSYHQK